MAKKVNHTFTVNITKNTLTERGGAWLLNILITKENDPLVVYGATTAWANPSAAKRWVKAVVQDLTPRKSVKLIAGENLDAKGKPVSFYGQLVFKA